MSHVIGRGRNARETYPQSPRAAGGALLGPSIITWAPGITNPTAPVFSDWFVIEKIVNDLQGNVILNVDQTGLSGFLPVPAAASLEGFGRLEIVGAGPLGETELNMADGAQIRNVRDWRTIVVRARPTVRPPVLYDIDGLIVEAFDATFLFGAAGPAPTKPIIQMAPNIYIGLLAYMSSQFRNGGAPGTAVLDIGAGSTLLLGIGLNFFGGVTFTDTISGPVGTTLDLSCDSTLVPPTLANFFGTYITSLESKAAATSYTAASAANWNGSPPATVAEALDRIAAKIGPIP